MKETIFIIMGVLLMPLAAAQTDTVQWGYVKYHYSLWYDTLPEFYTYYLHEDWPGLKLWEWYYDRHNQMMAMPQHVEGPTPVYGVAVTEPIAYSRSTLSLIQHDWYLPEYVYLFQKVGDTVVLLDSARWDTVPPKVMKLALNADTQRYGFALVKVYEAMFKEPVTVDSVFYTVSSNNGRDAHCGSMYYQWTYRPVWPMMVSNHRALFEPPWCPKPSWWDTKVFDFQTRQWLDYTQNNINSPIFGMYFPIVDYAELIVTSSDTSMGTAGPVAHVARNTTQNIWAIPKRGYRFSHWQEDWSPYATRSVYIWQDTTRFTAVFEPLARCSVEGESDDETMGYVTVGDSVYYEGDTAVLEAFAAGGMKFRYWSNGSTANPLRIVVTGDTVLTAHFSPLELYRVEGVSNDDVKGYVVVNDSVHFEDDTATLAAFALPGYVFSSWSTGDTANPLRIVVVSDTTVMAFFASRGVGVAPAGDVRATFVLMPNPARGQATVTLSEGFGGGMLRMQDAAGREVLRRELARGTRSCTLKVAELPAGTYFVTLATAEGTSTKRLVIR